MNTTATSYEAQLAQEAHSQDPTRATNLPPGPPRSNTGPPNPPRLLPVPRRAPRAEVGKEPPGNQVYFVQRPFCASNTRLLGKSAKRMKHELSFFFNTNPTGAILYPSHRKVSPTWTRDMCTLLKGTRLRTFILENLKLQSIPESRNGLVHLLVIIVETVNILVSNLPPRHSVDHLHCTVKKGVIL